MKKSGVLHRWPERITVGDPGKFRSGAKDDRYVRSQPRPECGSDGAPHLIGLRSRGPEQHVSALNIGTRGPAAGVQEHRFQLGHRDPVLATDVNPSQQGCECTLQGLLRQALLLRVQWVRIPHRTVILAHRPVRPDAARVGNGRERCSGSGGPLPTKAAASCRAGARVCVLQCRGGSPHQRQPPPCGVVTPRLSRCPQAHYYDSVRLRGSREELAARYRPPGPLRRACGARMSRPVRAHCGALGAA